MKCFIVFSLLTLGCALAQNLNDGRYYPELLNSKFDDGQYRPSNARRVGGQGSFGGSGGRGSGGRVSGSRGSGNRGSTGFGSSSSGSRFGSSGGSRFGGSAPAKVAFVPAPAPVFVPAPAPAFTSSSSGVGASNRNTGGFGSASRFGGSSGSSSASQDGVKEDIRELNEDGYFYRFLNENNIEVAETGRIDNRGSDNEVLRTNGYYEFVGDDGVRYRVDYVADENGFQPTGDHLPTPPPIPDEIVRALRLLSQG